MTEKEPAPKVSASTKKILLVDDDENILMMLKTTFEVEGFQVKTGRDGKNILKKAQEFLPHLIITDLMMPGGGGYELLRDLQSDSATRKIPVFIITGSTLNESTQAMMKQESNLAGYFQKPLRPEAFVREVHQKLNTISAGEEMKNNRKDAPVNFDDIF